jgi:DNA polymerase
VTTIDELRDEAEDCRRCGLWKLGSQVVFGEGAKRSLMLVGEQPGDVEDRAGRPFVGPAGKLLREVLEEVGIAPEEAYVTNAVKHFKWRAGGPGGKRRIHDKPRWTEVKACGHWLGLELATVRPEPVVCLGATAAQALLGRNARVGALRGQVLTLETGTPVMVTIHPSAVLRAGDERETRREALRIDLELAGKTVQALHAVAR